MEALNHALADVPAEASRIHICWGNSEMPRTTDVELKDIIDIILKVNPAGLMLMSSNGRHAHEWKVFRDVKLPDGKYVIPGVLDSTTNIVEHPEVVADRLINYAGVVGRDNVMAGPIAGSGRPPGWTWWSPASPGRSSGPRLRGPGSPRRICGVRGSRRRPGRPGPATASPGSAGRPGPATA